MDSSFINKVLPVGAIVSAMLTQTQFQQQCGSEWVLADGTTASGTRYNSITGNANLPDLRGRFLRGKDHGVGTDPAGDLALGTAQADRNQSHQHFIFKSGTGSGNVGSTLPAASSRTGAGSADYTVEEVSGQVADVGLSSLSGSDDARPKSIVINWFIKIN